MQKPMHWTQLLQAYEREWQFTKAEPVNGVTWSEWLAWRLRFGPKAIVLGACALPVLLRPVSLPSPSA